MKLFEELTQLHGVSGYETAVADYIKEKLAPLADDITTDPNGSVIAYFKGTGEHKKRIELAAHTDEIGFQVIKIEEDGRVGCYMLLAAMMNVKKPKNDVYLAFTVQEEVGTRGGQVTAQRIQPDIGVAVDVTPCHDRPGDLEGSNALDHGVAIKISDTGSISDEGLVNKSIALCKEHNVPYQKDVIYVGGGIKTIGFSVVTRYTHGPNAIVSQKDIEATVKMLELFMNADFE